MDKNFFIALAVSIALYLGYTVFFPPQPIQPATAAASQTHQQSAATTVAVTPTVSAQSASVQAVAPEQEAKLFTIETKTADITLTSKGAAVRDFVFKDVIKAVNLTPYPGTGFFATLPNINFDRVDSAEGDITFSAKIADNLTMLKTYTFSPDSEGLGSINIKLTNTGSSDLNIEGFNFNLGPGLNTVKSEEGENPVNWAAVCLIKEDGKKKATLNKIREKEMQSQAKLDDACSNWIWSGINNRYFLAAVIPQNWTTEASQLKYSSKFTFNKDSFFGLFGKKAVNGPQLNVQLPSIVPAKGSVEINSAFYFGPKNYSNLQKLPYDLDRAVQFGFFGQFGKWAKALLQWLYGVTHNYGWAIVLMTFLIQTAMLPLTYKQLKSSMVMQKIQPEMKRVQEKYKGDPATQQREMMALYKKFGANPFSGCLPLFIQMPIFLALFNALRTSWELHGAPFIFWITDLSAKDPFYILPIAMGAVMFFQQKMTMPQNMDDNPSMAMMKWMPIFMTVIFLNFPAGLTLYWFVSNCISFSVNIILKKRLAATGS